MAARPPSWIMRAGVAIPRARIAPVIAALALCASAPACVPGRADGQAGDQLQPQSTWRAHDHRVRIPRAQHDLPEGALARDRCRSALARRLGAGDEHARPGQLRSTDPDRRRRGRMPTNARIGFGSAIVAVPAEGEPVEEAGSLTALVGPPNSEHLEILFYAEGHAPVFAQLVFPGRLLEDDPPFSGRLDTAIPLIPTWPGGPDVAVTSMTSTIGPRGLTYYRHVHGEIVPFPPTRHRRAEALCARRGFMFRIDITFIDGTHQTATSAVPCPHYVALVEPDCCTRDGLLPPSNRE